MRSEPTGIIPPLTTPFTVEGDVYEKGLRELVEFQIRNGSHGCIHLRNLRFGPDHDRRRAHAESTKSWPTKPRAASR